MAVKVVKPQQAATNQQAPPQDLEAERCVLACCLLEPACVDRVASELREGIWYSSYHAMIWDCIRSNHDAGQAIDVISVARGLLARGQLHEVGGPAYLNEIMGSVPHTAHCDYYLRLMTEAHRLRLLIEYAQQISGDSYSRCYESASLVAEAQQRLGALSDGEQREDMRPLMDVLMEAVDHLQGDEPSGLETGFADLDELTGGLRGGQLIILAARPSVGKSAFALAVARHFCRRERGCLFVSLEMRAIELAERLIAMHGQVTHDALHRRPLGKSDLDEAVMCANLMGEYPLQILDAAGWGEARIAAAARVAQRKHDIKLLVVDYLQIAEPNDSSLPREQQISGMSRRFKQLAKALDIPVLLLSQLNREVEKRKDKRPLLADLRESGAIEQDADQVWMLYRAQAAWDNDIPPSESTRIIQDYRLPTGTDVSNIAEIYVRKNRSGRCGGVPLLWQGAHVMFQTLAIGGDNW